MTGARLLAVAALLGSCAWVRPLPPSDEDAIFPHPDEYDAGTAHGADAVARGWAICVQCHTEGNEQATDCATCHEPYPHPHGWRPGAVHGAGLHAPADRGHCTSCHAQPGLYATDRVGCTSCHAAYPHDDGWVDSGHGAFVVARGAQAQAFCGPCHGTDLAGGVSEVACTDCHADYPHSSGWSAGSSHGAEAIADPSSCADCHGDDGTGGGSTVACGRCHSTYPHDATWRSGGHLSAAQQLGPLTCMGCHDAGDGSPEMPATCSEGCHDG